MCFFLSLLLILLLPVNAVSQLRFAVVSDMQFAVGNQYNNSNYFLGVCQAILPYNIDFIISCGDNCPPDSVLWTIQQVFDPAILWFPCIGNHEMESFAFKDQLNTIIRKLPGIWIGFKPSVYSFDRGSVHFSVIDVYQKNNDGNIYNELYNWLEYDLRSTKQPIKLVIGHEPAFVFPDEDCDRVRHEGTSLDEYPANRDRFWILLQQYQVTAYLCGHTHNYSAREIDGIWQINCGHSRGEMDTGAPSMFVIIDIYNNVETIHELFLRYTVYRDTHDGNYDYQDIVRSFEIKIMNKMDNDAPGAPVNLKIFKK